MATKNRRNEKRRRARRKFTNEFKDDVVRLCQGGGESISDVCSRLDLTGSAVRGWVRKSEAQAETLDSSTSLTPSEKQELQRLRREIKQLKVEREILKKAATFFAKEST